MRSKSNAQKQWRAFMKVVAVMISLLLLLFSHTLFAQYGAKLCKKDPNYACHKVKRGETWKSLFPNDEFRSTVMRINRMNTKLYTGLTIAIPKTTNISVMDVSPFRKQIEAPGEKVIFVSISKLAWGAYDPDGTLVKWGPVSTAKGYCPDVGRGCRTATGEFAVYHKGGSGCASTRYPVGRGGAPMPYCMFFHGNYAMHGSHDVPGYNDSHGCVRMFVDDAKWLNEEFVGKERVPVVVKQF